MEDRYITTNPNTDTHLLQYLRISDIRNLILVNRCANGNLNGLSLIKQILHFITKYRNDNKQHYWTCINTSSYMIPFVCDYGYIKMLEWFMDGWNYRKYTTLPNLSREVVRRASYKGVVDILEWSKNRGYSFKDNTDIFDTALQCNRVNVLEWYHRNGYKITYYDHTIGWVITLGCHEVLEFLKNNGYDIMFNTSTTEFQCGIERAINGGRSSALQWLNENGYPITYSSEFISKLDVRPHNIHTIRWLNSINKNDPTKIPETYSR